MKNIAIAEAKKAATVTVPYLDFKNMEQVVSEFETRYIDLYNNEKSLFFIKGGKKYKVSVELLNDEK